MKSRRKAYVLIAVGTRRRWSTRPSLITTEEDLELVRRVGERVASAGFGTAKSLLFQQQATMDLIVEADDPRDTAARLAPLLAGLPVRVSAAGRDGNLSWVAQLWRHM